MSPPLDLQGLVQVIGPQFAEGAAERDAADIFVAGHYDVLKEHKVFSALIPSELGGGGVRHSAMCAFLRQLAHHCSSTALALSMHQHLVAAAVYNHAHGRPGRKLLEQVAAAEVVLVSTGANDWMESNGVGRPRRRRLPGQRQEAVRQRLTEGRIAGDVRPVRGSGRGMAGSALSGPVHGRGRVARRRLAHPRHARHRLPQRDPRQGLCPGRGDRVAATTRSLRPRVERDSDGGTAADYVGLCRRCGSRRRNRP